MRYAVFDLGSNSIKCVMAETTPRGVKVLRERSISTRLAEHLIDTAELRPEAIKRTLDALREIRAEAAAMGVDQFRASGHQRRARQPQPPRIPPRRPRGPSAFPSDCSPAARRRKRFSPASRPTRIGAARRPFILDVGGGSAEWVQGHEGKLQRRISLPLGAVRLRERLPP